MIRRFLIALKVVVVVKGITKLNECKNNVHLQTVIRIMFIMKTGNEDS